MYFSSAASTSGLNMIKQCCQPARERSQHQCPFSYKPGEQGKPGKHCRSHMSCITRFEMPTTACILCNIATMGTSAMAVVDTASSMRVLRNTKRICHASPMQQFIVAHQQCNRSHMAWSKCHLWTQQVGAAAVRRGLGKVGDEVDFDTPECLRNSTHTPKYKSYWLLHHTWS